MSDLSPSQQIVAEANATATVTDKRGRTLELRRLRGRALAQFMRACGPMADVQTYFGEAVLRAAVVSIDGRTLPVARTADMVDALWDRVDIDAATAAAEWFTSQGAGSDDAP